MAITTSEGDRGSLKTSKSLSGIETRIQLARVAAGLSLKTSKSLSGIETYEQRSLLRD